MSKKILLVGESWMSFTTHVKGFDTFYTSVYETGKEWIENMEYKQRNVNMAISLTGNWANCIAATFQLIFMLVIGLMILYGYLNMIYMMPIVNVSNNFISNLNDISSNLAGFKSVSDVNSKLLNIIDSHGQANKFVSNYDGNIYLEHVSFGYTESKMIIDDLSFKFEKGKKYAIVGPSGSGKSTILKLILGYYPVQKGNVSVLDSKNVSMIHQESHIFDDTIRNNLNMELVQTDETLLKCLEFVDLPEFKLDQNICEDGSNLSGGQVQRIGIARTIAHLKEVLLCDEITASLDAQTAIEIENRILNLKDEKKYIIVLKEIVTLRNRVYHNDKILVNLNENSNNYVSSFIVLEYLKKCDIDKDVRNFRILNPTIRQLTCLLYIFNIFVTSNEVKDHVNKLLNDFMFERVVRNKKYFTNNELLKQIYIYFEKIIIKEFANGH